MEIGVLREIKPDEGRVALTPSGAAALAARGHRVVVEDGAGARAGYDDESFARAGATVAGKAGVLARARLLLKVKAPLPQEYGDYRPDQTLFTFFHLDENIPGPEIARMIAGGFLGLACEAVAVGGRRPILEPMSRLTGYLFAHRALDLCIAHRGVLAAGLDPGGPRGRAVLVGTGAIGLSVLRTYGALGLSLTVLANARRSGVNAAANARFGTTGRDYLPRDEVTFLQMDETTPERTQALLGEALATADILINAAVRRRSLPRTRLPHLVTRTMVAGMPPGAIVCDATACDRDLIETCVSSPDLRRTDLIEGVVHHSPDHIPALVPRSASDLFADSTLPFVTALADGGIVPTLDATPALRDAVVCAGGALTASAAAGKGLPVAPVETALSTWARGHAGDGA